MTESVTSGSSARILHRITGDTPPPAFALIHRPHSGHGGVELLAGTVSAVQTTVEIPLPEDPATDRHDALAILPYRQVTERGLDCHDDGAPLLVLTVRDQAVAPVAHVARALAEVPVQLRDNGFDLDDRAYADRVRRIQREEIGTGAGSNFVLARSYRARLGNWSIRAALTLFGRLLSAESGSYWTFLIHTGEHTFLGASPERHLGLDAGLAVMNPISGTYRYPPSGPSQAELLRFLADDKEADELYMVADEELKMMSRICPRGGWIRGPELHEMAHLAHTGYLVEGHTELDPRQVLRETLFAPTIVGSPLANACTVVARHETRGRSYYGGVAALFGRDRLGRRQLDSAIMIRTAEIDSGGHVRLDVGATLVRDSDPDGEAAETVAKAAGVLAALRSPRAPAATASRTRLADSAAVRDALAHRNATLAPFWLQQHDVRRRERESLCGRRVLIVEADDSFAHMGRVLLDALGLDVVVGRLHDDWAPTDFDLVVIGPGPGDPRRNEDPRIGRLRLLARTLLGTGIPLLAVCLGHQALCAELGLPLIRKPVPHQGVQRRVDFFGRPEPVYFYNTFAAVHHGDRFVPPGGGPAVEVCGDDVTGEIHALRAPRFASVQFHPASIRTPNGLGIVEELLCPLMTRGAVRSPVS